MAEPKILGKPLIGQTLTAVTGTWLPSGAQSSVIWTRNGTAIPDARGLTYVVTAEDFKHTLGATVVTQVPKLAPDTRHLTLNAPVRAVPTFSIKAVPSDIEHGKRLMITASGLGRQLSGAVRIVENGERLATRRLYTSVPTSYDYKAEPGTHVVTFVYVGSEWLVPTSRVVTMTIK